MIRHLQPLQKYLNTAKSSVLDTIVAVTENLSSVTGRSFYPRYEIHANYPLGAKATIWQCIQTVETLSWWRRLLVLFTRRCCRFSGVKYSMVGRTNSLDNARQWANGGKKSLLVVV